MERDEDLLISLINFLLAHGYPKDSLAMEWPIGGKYRVDLAVIDPDTNKAVALFELKRKETEESLSMAYKQLLSYSKALGVETVPLYAVFGKKGDPPFNIYYLQKEKTKERDLQPYQVKKVPDFSIFKSSKVRQAISQTAAKRATVFNWFQFVCWIMALIVAVLLALNFLKKLEISPEQLTLICVIVALIITPFASELKILGIEFKRLTERKNSDK